MENNIVNVYGYIRVSTEGQVKQGYSLAEQRAEIEKYCSSKSYNLIEIFKDEGISGAKANEDEMSIERDGLLDMLASLKENKIQYIVVLSTNRLCGGQTYPTEMLSLSNYAAYFLLLFYIPSQRTDCHDQSE